MEPRASEAAGLSSLPETCLSDPRLAEEGVLERWRSEETFQGIQAAREGAEPFVFWEGPPTANGRPGIHHVLARTLKDSVCRYQTMLGRRVVRKAGWDTHGLPVEIEVEKRLGISGKRGIEELGVGEFNRLCRESVWQYKEEWERLSERIAYWLDYQDPYVTYEPDYVESLWWLLARLHREGLVYRGKRVLPYCGRCGTGLSSHELGQPGVYRDVLDPSVVLRFRRVRDAGAESAPTESFLAWTTTPWTLPSNFALAVHPDREYVLALRTADDTPGGEERVWVVRERAAAVLGEEGVGWSVLDTRRGSELSGLRYEPLFPVSSGGEVLPVPDARAEHAWRVVTADFVTVEDGTGIVHQAPYGADDWQTATRGKTVVQLFVGADGRFAHDVPSSAGGAPVVAAGTPMKEADKAIRRDLRARGLLFADEQSSHSYPHCWRCDTPLYYFPSDAWFIRTTAIKDRLIDNNRHIRWVPSEVGQKRFGEWLENNVDWNVSRDRFWGTPLPFWVCDGCGAETAIGSVAELGERATAPLPEGFDNHKPAIDQVVLRCSECGGEARRTPQVADAWFDSGAMPFAQYHWPFGEEARARVRDQFPADFICEGLDQTRGWFYTLHVLGTFFSALADNDLEDGPAFRSCLVNGLVLDKDGVKMSKRLGNVVDPWKAIEAHGADAVRWYLISSGSAWLPKRFDERGLSEARARFLVKLVHSFEFFREYARLDAFDPADPGVPPTSERPEIDRWILSRCQTVVAESRARLDACDLTGAARAVDGFLVDDLSNWYIRRNRRRFWKSEPGPDKLAAHATLHAALRTVTLLIAPMAPFLAELLWERLEPGTGSVHAQPFPRADERLLERDLEGAMAAVQEVVAMGRALRERAGLRVRQPLRALHLRAGDPDLLALLATPFAREQILDELNVREVGSLAADEGDLVRLSAKPNFRLLGKRLGQRMKAAAAVIASLPAEHLELLREGSEVVVELDGEPLTLGPDEVLVTVESQADFDVETDGRVVLWLDTDLDPSLVREGLAREVVSRVNGLRKERGLAVEDRIRLSFWTHGADQVVQALEHHRGLIQEATLAVELAVDGPPGEGRVDWDLGDERRLSCDLTRSSV